MAVRSVRVAERRPAARSRPLALATVTAVYAGSAVVATWPAVRSFGSAFIADGQPGYGEPSAGDHLQTVYRFWLVGHQLAHGAAPWRDPYSFQPLVDEQPALGGWPFGVPFWPLHLAFGPVVAWNTLLLVGIVAAGLLTYGWLRALDVSPPAAALGGLAFAIAPYRIVQSGGHLLGWIAILLPLCLLAIERSRAAAARSSAHAWGVLAAASLVSVPLSGQVHLALGAVPFVLGYALVRFRLSAFAWTLAGAAAAVCVGLLIRYTIIAGSIEAGGRSLSEVDRFQADWSDLVNRFTRWPATVFASESFVYVGWLTPVLAAAGVIILLRSKRRRLAVLLGVGAVVPLALALGTNLPTYSPLWHALPPLRFPRVPERLLPIADLALAALAAFAVDALLRRIAPRMVVAVSAGLAVLLVADLAVQPLRASAADPHNTAYARLPQAGRILELPLFEPGIHYGSVYEYFELQAAREHPSGYSTLAPRRAFDFFFRLNRLNCGVWLGGDAAELRSLGIRSILFHRGLYAQAGRPGAWFAWNGLAAHGFRPVVAGGAVTLLQRRPGRAGSPPVAEPSRERTVFCEGWSGWTMRERQGPLWVYATHRLELDVTAPARTEASVWLDGNVVRRIDVAGPTAIVLRLGGERWHSVILEVPELFRTIPPQGLRLLRIRRS
jgi:hypothetical protein